MGLDAFVEAKDTKDVWAKFNELRQYLLSKGYNETTAWIEAAKKALKPEARPMAMVPSGEHQSKDMVRNITFIFDDESYPLISTFFDSNRNDIVSWHKSKLLVEIVRRLVGK